MLLTLTLLSVVRLCVGTTSLGWEDSPTILNLRLTRMTCALLVGASLAVSGVMLQALLRNPLAEPFILGISSGAGLGVMIHTLIAGAAFATSWGLAGAVTQQLAAILGAGLSMLVVFLAGQRRGVVDPLGLLLVGVVLGTINGAIILALQYFADAYQVTTVSRWMMGWLNESTGAATMVFVGVLLSGAMAVSVSIGSAMDVATFSDAEAQSMGVNLRLLRVLMLVIAGALTAASVVLAGPVAFVGLIAPHTARLILGPAHLPVILASAMIGAALILMADIASTLIALYFSVGQLPIGVFTALLGGVVFLWMLRPQLGRGVE